MGIRWLDPFVVVLARFDDFEAELFVELDRVLVVDLHVQENTVKVGVPAADVVEDVFHHFGADPQATVRGQAPEGHDVEAASGGLGGVDTAANGTDHHVVVVGCNGGGG